MKPATHDLFDPLAPRQPFRWPPLSLLRRAVRACGSLRSVVLRHIRRRATYRELSGLSDQSLKDLGVYRGDIWTIADDLALASLAADRTARHGGAGEEQPPADEEPPPCPRKRAA